MHKIHFTTSSHQTKIENFFVILNITNSSFTKDSVNLIYVTPPLTCIPHTIVNPDACL